MIFMVTVATKSLTFYKNLVLLCFFSSKDLLISKPDSLKMLCCLHPVCLYVGSWMLSDLYAGWCGYAMSSVHFVPWQSADWETDSLFSGVFWKCSPSALGDEKN